VNANRVHGNLWMSHAPKPEDGFRMSDNFDVLVLAAEEHQPSGRFFPGVKVIHAPLDDTTQVPANELRIAKKAAAMVATALSKGKRVLVTCWLGRNRSGIITALALVRMGAQPEKAIELVRRARGEHALSNPTFVEIILESRPISENASV
jgi:protein-tyrosine phosphatase